MPARLLARVFLITLIVALANPILPFLFNYGVEVAEYLKPFASTTSVWTGERTIDFHLLSLIITYASVAATVALVITSFIYFNRKDPDPRFAFGMLVIALIPAAFLAGVFSSGGELTAMIVVSFAALSSIGFSLWAIGIMGGCAISFLVKSASVYQVQSSDDASGGAKTEGETSEPTGEPAGEEKIS